MALLTVSFEVTVDLEVDIAAHSGGTTPVILDNERSGTDSWSLRPLHEEIPPEELTVYSPIAGEFPHVEEM